MEAYPKSHLKTALLMALTLIVLLTALPARESPKGTNTPISLSIDANAEGNARPASGNTTPAQPTASIAQTAAETTAGDDALPWRSFDIRHGDSLSSLFSRAGLTPQDLHAVMHSGKIVSALKKIKPGKTIDIALDANGGLQALRYRISSLRNLIVEQNGNSFQAHWQTITPKELIAYATGAITRERPSLYLAGRQAGLPDNIIMALANIFQWDVSFALDLRPGDTFAVMYRENYVDGNKVGDGDILAAEFTNMGKRYQAVLYQDASGHKSYYAPNGESMRKAFLRDPVHFSYISSGFNPHRMHPIFHRIMPHWGVDFVARKGTPVMASGDGRVTIARRNAASGRYVVIQHGSEYTTKYLHLSAFAHGIHPGAAVKQGQVIGYVGESGWATAPHLHYEFLVNGVHRNPRTVPLPKATPVAPGEMARFRMETTPVLAKLDAIAGKTGYATATRTTNGVR